MWNTYFENVEVETPPHWWSQQGRSFTVVNGSLDVNFPQNVVAYGLLSGVGALPTALQELGFPSNIGNQLRQSTSLPHSYLIAAERCWIMGKVLSPARIRVFKVQVLNRAGAPF